MLVGIHQLLGMQNLPRGMADDFHFAIPLWRRIVTNQSYRLLWGDTGFARMAIAAGCPVIPFGAVGAEDRFQVLVDSNQRVAAPVRALIRRVAGRTDVGTLLERLACVTGAGARGR
jgi:1-acyl-sn-glycerol-3-phosphate acyltransferase